MRIDKRYKNAEEAPQIVSEKRLTFFLADEAFSDLKLLSGYGQIDNAEGNDCKLPETPSAVIRLFTEYMRGYLRGKVDPKVETEVEAFRAMVRSRLGKKGKAK